MPTVGRWQYLVEEPLSGEIVGSLPLTQFKYVRLLNRPGSFRAQLHENQADPELLTPGQKAIYACRDGAIEFGGMVWTANLGMAGGGLGGSPSSDDTVFVTGEGWLGYWDHRLVNFNWATIPSGLDEFLVFQGLLSRAQDSTIQGTHADLGITVAWDTISGIPVTAAYVAADQKNLGQELRALSQANDGFDMNMRLGLTGNSVSKVIRLDHPFAGRETGFTFRHSIYGDRPGLNVVSRAVTNDATNSAWRVWSQGNGQGNAKLNAYRSDETKRGLWPLLDSSVSWNSQQDQLQLDRFTEAALARKTGALRLPQITLNPSQAPFLGEFDLGDIVTNTSDSPYLGGEDVCRISGIAVEVDDQHSEKVTLLLERLVDSVPGE